MYFIIYSFNCQLICFVNLKFNYVFKGGLKRLPLNGRLDLDFLGY